MRQSALHAFRHATRFPRTCSVASDTRQGWVCPMLGQGRKPLRLAGSLTVRNHLFLMLSHNFSLEPLVPLFILLPLSFPDAVYPLAHFLDGGPNG